jgi:hypothetical protein
LALTSKTILTANLVYSAKREGTIHNRGLSVGVKH